MKLTKNWIVGFVDGHGQFGIEKTQIDCFYFAVCQDKRSLSVLYAIKTFFKCGSVHKLGKNTMQYKVTSKKHLTEIIIPFFEKNPLITTKRDKFNQMAQQCLQSIEKPRPVNGQNQIIGLTSEWLLGFIDAKACFVCSQNHKHFIPQMIIGLHPKDKATLDTIQSFLAYGIRYTHEDKTEIFQVSSQSDLYDFVTNYLLTKGSKDRLRTQKRITARKWAKLILYLQTKQHLLPEGFEKACQKYNLFKQSKHKI